MLLREAPKLCDDRGDRATALAVKEQAEPIPHLLVCQVTDLEEAVSAPPAAVRFVLQDAHLYGCARALDLGQHA